MGKTETGLAVADQMFGGERFIVSINMSEFQDREMGVSALVGAKPGYVGYGKGGTLTEAVRQRPYSVVLLDEIEKAHRDVLKVFMPVFDEGRFTTDMGKVADFSHAIFVLTSNLGTVHEETRIGPDVGGYEPDEERQARRAKEFDYQVRQAISRHLLPEILGRIREMVVFQPLTKEALCGILDLHLAKLNRRRGFVDRDIEVALDDSARDLLIEKGYSTEAGARELIRTLDRYVVSPLAAALVSGEVSDGNRVVCRREGDELEFDIATGDVALTLTLSPRTDPTGG